MNARCNIHEWLALKAVYGVGSSIKIKNGIKKTRLFLNSFTMKLGLDVLKDPGTISGLCSSFWTLRDA